MSTEYLEEVSDPVFSTPFSIESLFSSPDDGAFEQYLATAQTMINKMIPESYWIELDGNVPEEAISAAFYRLSKEVPILEYSTFSDDMDGISIKVLCPSEFTQGMDRYISDTFSHWLVPSKHLESAGSFSIQFKFKLQNSKNYYFRQEFFRFSHPSDRSVALSNIAKLIKEVRLNILAVYHARYISSMKGLDLEQRNQIIQENLLSLVSPYLKSDRSIYDQMHHLLSKLSDDEKAEQVKKTIANLVNLRPQNFDRDVFYEMAAFTTHFSTNFVSIHECRHISRVIALHYLFKKSMLKAIKFAPNERHISFKLLKSSTSPVVAIITAMNLLKETERFDKKHLMSAIQTCLPHVVAVDNSFIVDRREEKIRIFYLEIQKPGQQPFTLSEIRLLQQELPTLFKRQVENVVHPIFMPRNEEEVLRNIVLLSKQIKFLRDLPHLTIHYEKQSDSEISFLIVLVRLLRENDLPFKELLKNREPGVTINVDEVRSAGSLKGRYPKEAVIFRVILDKSSFFRKDYSLDLKRARQKVGAELRQLLGEFRDYNGGMIHKQDEALEQLRKTIGATASDHEILLENFFYSLRPGIMQTVHPPEMLKTLYTLLLEALKEDLTIKGFSVKSACEEKYLFIMIAAAAPTFREEVQAAVAKLKIASYDLTSTFLHVQEFATIGYIYRTDEGDKRTQFQQTLQEAMLKWKINFSCQIKLSY